MKPPTSQTSSVLYKLIEAKQKVFESEKTITHADFEGYPRISEYIRVLRKKFNLEIKTIPVKFVSQYGFKGEYGSYKLLSETNIALEVYEKIIAK